MRYQILPSEEENTLREAVKNHENSFFRDRCQSILLSNQHINVQTIAKTFNVRTRTIYEWFDKYESHSFLGLMTHKGQGRRPTISVDNSQHTTKIIEWVDKGESLKEVADLFKKEFEISVSKAMIKDFIKKKGTLGKE